VEKEKNSYITKGPN